MDTTIRQNIKIDADASQARQEVKAFAGDFERLLGTIKNNLSTLQQFGGQRPTSETGKAFFEAPARNLTRDIPKLAQMGGQGRRYAELFQEQFGQALGGSQPSGSVSYLQTPEYQNLSDFYSGFQGLSKGSQKAYAPIAEGFVKGAYNARDRMVKDALSEYSKTMGDARGLTGDAGSQKRAQAETGLTSATQNIDDMSGAIVLMSDNMKKATEEVKKSGRMLPAYIGTVINTLGQAVNMYVRYNAAEQTMFNLDSSVGMTSALKQKDILQTQMLYGGTARTIGSALGAAIGSVGGTPGMLAGMYIGESVAEPIGQALGTFKTAPKEEELKVYQSTFAKNQQMASYAMGVETSRFGTRRFRGGKEYSARYDAGMGFEDVTQQNARMAQYEIQRGGENVKGFENLYGYAWNKGYTNPDEITKIGASHKWTGVDINGASISALAEKTGMQGRNGEMIDQYLALVRASAGKLGGKNATYESASYLSQLPSAILGTDNELGKLSEGGMQTINSMLSFATPKDEAQRAFLFRAIAGGKHVKRDKNGKADFIDVQERMLQGGYNPENMVDELGILPKDKRTSMLYAQTLMADAPANVRARIGNPEGRDDLISQIENMKGVGNVKDEVDWAGTALRTPEQIKGFELSKQNLAGGEKVMYAMKDIEIQWNKGLSDMSSSAEILMRISRETSLAMQKMQSIYADIRKDSIGDRNLTLDQPGSGARTATARKSGYSK